MLNLPCPGPSPAADHLHKQDHVMLLVVLSLRGAADQAIDRAGIGEQGVADLFTKRWPLGTMHWALGSGGHWAPGTRQWWALSAGLWALGAGHWWIGARS